VDASGMSSGLRQVHKTRPISTLSSKESAKTLPEMPPPSSPAAPANAHQSRKLFWISMFLIGLITLVVFILMANYLLHPDERPAAALRTPEPARSSSRETNFIGIPLVGRRIIISIDAASSMSDSFDFLRRGVARAAGRLRPDQPLLLTLWTNDGLKQLPTSGFGQGDAFVKDLIKALQAATPEGASDAEKSMQQTLDLVGPGDQVIFISAKDPLPASLTATVLPHRKNNVRIDGVKLVSQDTPSPFEAMAAATGGQYVFLVPSELDQATR
jgi:hypothetical protein